MAFRRLSPRDNNEDRLNESHFSIGQIGPEFHWGVIFIH